MTRLEELQEQCRLAIKQSIIQAYTAGALKALDIAQQIARQIARGENPEPIITKEAEQILRGK